LQHVSLTDAKMWPIAAEVLESVRRHLQSRVWYETCLPVASGRSCSRQFSGVDPSHRELLGFAVADFTIFTSRESNGYRGLSKLSAFTLWARTVVFKENFERKLWKHSVESELCNETEMRKGVW
jgi:hypothetical protein